MNADAVCLSLDRSTASNLPRWPAGRVQLFGSITSGWKLVNPLPVMVEREDDGTCIISDEMFNVYGAGPSWDEAEHDYKVALVEYLGIMSEGNDPGSRKVVAHVGTYLKRV